MMKRSNIKIGDYYSGLVAGTPVLYRLLWEEYDIDKDNFIYTIRMKNAERQYLIEDNDFINEYTPCIREFSADTGCKYDAVTIAAYTLWKEIYNLTPKNFNDSSSAKNHILAQICKEQVRIALRMAQNLWREQ